jgi:protein-S-isoprenylcysteine O-methyltransferase Ste14
VVIAIAVLPFSVAVLITMWLAHRTGMTLVVGSNATRLRGPYRHNAVYIPQVEEPLLAQRFGAAYREYCRHVPRLLPRRQPWDQAGR